jgi:predicted HicB family RNase H-like nuclease
MTDDEKRVPVSVRIKPSVAEWARNAAWHEQKPLGELIEEAIEAHLKRAEKKRGRPFPKRGN